MIILMKKYSGAKSIAHCSPSTLVLGSLGIEVNPP
jgi:hypothetical protein